MQSLILPKIGKAVMSENGHYIIVASDTHSLYVHPADTAVLNYSPVTIVLESKP